MLEITPNIAIQDDEFDLTAIRAQGAGGQNVNKVSSAIHLRFDIHGSSLPEVYKESLLASRDSRITVDGILVIKAQRFRTQEQNKEDALERLADIIRKAGDKPKARRPTRPTKASQARRVDSKKKQGQIKSMRKKVGFE